MVVPVEESDVSAVTAEVAAGAGGVILFGTAAPPDLGSALARLAAAAPRGAPPLVMTDEEGGYVQRMPNVTGGIPSARYLGETTSAAGIERLAAVAGSRLRAVGVTMDLAPVLDLDAGPGPNSRDAIGSRSFSPVASVAATDGWAFAAGLRSEGVLPVAKHFPGLGGTTGNTDIGPAATLPWSTLQSSGLLPFRYAVAAGVPAVMVSNASVPGLTSLPASLSTAVIDGVLRDQLHFAGLVVTDSLSAGAVEAAGYSVPEAAVAALRAGADLVLFGAPASRVASLTDDTVDAIVSAVDSGRLSRDRLAAAVEHVLHVKALIAP